MIRPLAYSSPPTYREKTASFCFLLTEKGVGLVVGGAYVSFLFPWKYTPWTLAKGAQLLSVCQLKALPRSFYQYSWDCVRLNNSLCYI